MKQPISQIPRIWWLQYLKFIRHRIPAVENGEYSGWSGLSFVYVVAFSIPFCLLAIVPRIIYSLGRSDLYNALFGALFLLFLFSFLLNKRPGINSKKVFSIGMIYLFSINLLLQNGTQGPGILYVVLASVFSSILFHKSYAYYTLLVNVLILFVLGMDLRLNWFSSYVSSEYEPITWFFYSANLLFVNLVSIVLIRRVISRLERIINNENELLGQLADESLEIAELNNRLKESEDYYRYLFASNPIPMYVFDVKTFHFMQVNEATIQMYGYTRDELLTMTMLDIRPPEYRESIEAQVREAGKTKAPYLTQTVHRKKDNTEFSVEIRSNPIEINGRKGRLVLATDITERQHYIKSIEAHNKRLQDIAWIQSHQVRAPLARIMSLVTLLKDIETQPESQEMLNYLDISANELNEIITKVIRRAE